MHNASSVASREGPRSWRADEEQGSRERLTWLMRLRWLALFGVSAAGVTAELGLVPGLNQPVVALALILGILGNLSIGARLRDERGAAGLLQSQSHLDICVLSLVLWAAGGLECPFSAFYVFPVLLSALLAGGRLFWSAVLASAVGLAWQWMAVKVAALRIGHWNPSPPWDELLHFSALALTVGMVAYFTTRFIEALRQQSWARRDADMLLRMAFENLEAGVELIEGHELRWQNPYARARFGARSEGLWRCPGAGSTCPISGQAQCPPLDTIKRGCEFRPQGEHEAGLQRSYELLLLSPPSQSRRLALYVDRSVERASQERLIRTERLASLGRAAQGVAHELNTPLATIQTLGRDLLDTLTLVQLEPSMREDFFESASLIIDEVGRCRRITHALLGRPQQARSGEALPISTSIERALSVISPRRNPRIHLDLGASNLSYPVDPIIQITVNLVQNALDASPEGMVSLSLQESEHTLSLRVRDKGPGISELARAHLFEPFFTTKGPGEGTGLGLYTSYLLARSLGGQLSVERHPEGGTIARLDLPLSAGRERTNHGEQVFSERDKR
ncbi:MAG: ATP-binding protein [Myxococcota bacterium]|nr:ATP-binding protein [Myxococcota bacterium]